MKKIVVVGALALVGFGLSGCGSSKFSEQFNDAPRTGVENSKPVDIISNADGFSNVSTKCDHGNRLYVAYKGNSPYAAIAVVAADPSCK